MRHHVTQLRAAPSGGASPSGSDSPAPPAATGSDAPRSAVAAETPEETAAAAAAAAAADSPHGDSAESEGPGAMDEEPPEDMDFLSGLELADLLDPRHLEGGLGSPGPPSSSGAGSGSDSGGLWRGCGDEIGDDDDEAVAAAAAAEMQRFSELLQRLLSGMGGGGGGGGEGDAGGERRRRKGGNGGSSGGEGGPAAPKSPRKAAAAAARLNRLKKKEYVLGLESRVRGLAAENQELRAENRELGRRVQALQEESRYLRAVLANESGLARLLGRLSGVGLRLGTSLLRDAPAGDHDYALPVGKPRPDGDAWPPDDDPISAAPAASSGGVCLHVDKDKVSVEFCAACARKAAASSSSALKIFFFR